MYTLREKMEREIEKGMPNILHYFAETELDVNKEFNSLLTTLRYQHSYVCKLVMNNLDKIKKEIEKERERENDVVPTSFEKYYDYSYIVNLLWSYRYVYAVKMFRDRMEITEPFE
jgi:hypothetical protein